MSHGKMSTVGTWYVGKMLVYFEKGIIGVREIRKKMREVHTKPEAADYQKNYCGGACCVDQPRIVS